MAEEKLMSDHICKMSRKRLEKSFIYDFKEIEKIQQSFACNHWQPINIEQIRSEVRQMLDTYDVWSAINKLAQALIVQDELEAGMLHEHFEQLLKVMSSFSESEPNLLKKFEYA